MITDPAMAYRCGTLAVVRVGQELWRCPTPT